MGRLPKEAAWYADPSGANERSEMRCAGFSVREGSNAIRPGVAAVSARLENGTLRVLRGACPNLVAEAQLYRWAEEGKGESPEDEHNHALAALRYLVMGLDGGGRGAWRPKPPAPPKAEVPWWRRDDPGMWTKV